MQISTFFRYNCCMEPNSSHFFTFPHNCHKFLYPAETMVPVLDLFLTDLLSPTQGAANTHVSLVSDNARVMGSHMKDCMRREVCVESRHEGGRPVRSNSKNSLDVSDHTKGESRWESTSVSGQVSPLVTPTRRDGYLRKRHHSKRALIAKEPSLPVLQTDLLSPVQEFTPKIPRGVTKEDDLLRNVLHITKMLDNHQGSPKKAKPGKHSHRHSHIRTRLQN